MWDYKTATRFNYIQLREFARQNRLHMTEAETLLWKFLRNRGVAGRRFMRQHIIGHYIVDFVCEDDGLVIEVDGRYHSEPLQAQDDELRTQFLESMGFRVLRFSNDEILHDIEAVVDQIEKELE
ncbi:MAG: endonuclease domain-containing protein [Bacteroidales bacterium]|nr:endonuclease domain-containing protein [Bacteroidales bacterium]